MHSVATADESLEARARMMTAFALRDRASYQPDEDLSVAAAHCERSIAIYRERGPSLSLGEALATLGSLHVHERARYQTRSNESLAQTIAILETAVELLPADQEPAFRASALFYLGQALLGDEATPLPSARKAAEAFERSLELRQQLPQQQNLAAAEEALANALSELPEEAAQHRAKDLYRSAINRLGPSRPYDRFRVQRNLGFVDLEKGRWETGAEAFQAAARIAVEASLGRQEAHRGLFRAGDLAECRSAEAYCLARMGQIEKAIVALDQGRGVGARNVSPSPELIQSVVLPDERVVAPILTPVGSLAIVFDGRGCAIVDLPGIDNLFAALRPSRVRGRQGWLRSFAVWRGDQSRQTLGLRMRTLEVLLREIRTAFVEPLLANRAVTGCRRITLLPQGGLQVFPIHAAYSEETDGRRYFATDHTVGYIPSLSFLCKERLSARETDLEASLVVGLKRYRDPRLRPLPLAELEAQAIGGDRAMTGRQASRSALLRRLPQTTLAHFACHASWSPDPARSALQLWSSRPGQREELTAGEIETGGLDLSRIRLVVLSACDSGVTEHFFAPDELAGLPGAILRAGASGIISSLWAVHDIASFVLWPQFYEGIKSGLSPVESLAEAQRWLRRLTLSDLRLINSSPTYQDRLEQVFDDLMPTQKPFSHPLLWASFAYYRI